MTRLLAALALSWSLVGCSLLDGPAPSVVDPSPTPEPVVEADLLVYGAVDPDPQLPSSFVEVMARGYELALAETENRVGEWRVELVRELPDEIVAKSEEYGIGVDEIGFHRSAIAFARYDERLIAFLGPHHKYAFDDSSVERVCREGLLMISSIQGSPSRGSGCPEQRFFRTASSAGENGLAAARYLSEESLTRVVVLLSKNDPGRALPAWEDELDAFRSQAGRADIEILGEYDLLKMSASKLRSLNPQAFVLLGRVEEAEARRFWSLREEIATVPAIVASSALRDFFEPFGRETSPAGPVIIASAIPVVSGIPGYESFAARWNDRYGAPPPKDDEWLAMNSYAAMKAILVGIERAREAGIVEPRAIRAALPSIVAGLTLSGAPYGTTWGFTGAGERYPAIGGAFLIDFTVSEIDGMFPIRTLFYE